MNREIQKAEISPNSPVGTGNDNGQGINKSFLYNKDLAPIPPEKRTWTLWNISALWAGMAIGIPTYTIASSLILQGMNWKQAMFTLFLGNAIMVIPLTLNAHPGTKYGIPFPILLRASFGVIGANIPAMMRGLVACCWFGIQTWIGGTVIYAVAVMLIGFDPAAKINLPILGISVGQFTCFLIFWAMNIAVILKGINCVKWLENLSAPYLLILGLGLLVWAYGASEGFVSVWNQKSKFQSFSELFDVSLLGVTAIIGFWSTLALNIPDFSRYARSQTDQIVGQSLGLPPAFTFYAFVGIIVTSATASIFGREIADPIELMTQLDSPVLVVFALVSLSIATLSTNIAANVVSPSNDFSNLWPRRISFKMGGVITGILGILIFPWKFYSDPTGSFIFFLVGYSALLGPIGGIMVADYFVYRKMQLNVPDLYHNEGEYAYTNGFSYLAFASLLIGVIPNVPGFLAELNWVPPEMIPEIFKSIFRFAWMSGFAISFLAYLMARWLSTWKGTPRSNPTANLGYSAK